MNLKSKPGKPNCVMSWWWFSFFSVLAVLVGIAIAYHWIVALVVLAIIYAVPILAAVVVNGRKETPES